MNLKLSGGINKKTNKGKLVGIVIGAVVAVVAVGYTAVGYTVYGARFTPGTVINGIDCGNKTVENAKLELESVIDSYSLEVTDGTNTDTITAEDISLKGDFDNELNNAIDGQSKILWGKGLLKKQTLETEPVVSFDEAMLNQKINEMTLVSGEQVTDSVDAKLQINDENRFEVVPEVYGTRLNADFAARVTEAVTTLEPTIDLTQEDYYIKPNVYSDNEAMLTARDTVNKWLDAVITYKFGSNTEVVDASLVKDWIVIADDYSTYYFNRDEVKEFVRSLSRKYDTFGDTRTFKTTYGFNVSVEGGDYGYRINRESEIDDLVADIKTGESKERKPIYYQEGASYDGLDIGNTYVEVDLTGQHLFLYKDGAMMLESELVSGRPSRGGTPNGTYGITYCERNATLRGEDYETPVDYWMPFNGDIGLHDATWQPKFGGDWYVNHGSHGCVNLPLDIAAQIFGYAYKNMPVVCYRYGTEDYNAVEAYRSTKGLPSIFDTQPSGEAATQATTAAQ
jgi:hypothetical protein